MTELPQLQSFPSLFLCQMEVLHKQMDKKLATFQAHYKHIFDRTIKRTPRFYFGHQVLIDRQPEMKTESTRKASVLLAKLLPITLSPLKIISATLGTLTVDDNRILSGVQKVRVTLARYSAQSCGESIQKSNTNEAKHRRIDYETEENDAGIIGELPMQHKAKHRGTGKSEKFIDRWYGYRPDAHTVELLYHIQQNLFGR